MPFHTVLRLCCAGALIRLLVTLHLLADSALGQAEMASETQTETVEGDSHPNGRTSSESGRQALFFQACTQCHNAERALSKTKSAAEWLATVQRMSSKSGARIPAQDIRPIADYLATHAVDSQTTDETNLALNATISTLYRGSSDGARLEHPGFFVDAWITAEWQPNRMLSGRATACTSCHGDGECSV